MKPVYVIASLVISVIFATKLELPWYIGTFFVWGVVDFVSSVYNAIVKTNGEFRK